MTVQLVKQEKPNPSGPWVYKPIFAVATSAGAADAGKVVLVGPDGKIDVTLMGVSLPSQTGNGGKYLTTDGADASWVTISFLPDQTGQAGKFLTTDGSVASWAKGSDLTNIPLGTPVSLPSAGKAQLFPDYQPVSMVPHLTSNTDGGGLASASTSYASVYPWEAFSGGTRNGWFTDGTSLPQWLQYEFPTPTLIRGYSIVPWSIDTFPTRTPTGWEVQGSEDGLSWTTLDSRSFSGWAIEDRQSFHFANTVAYRQYRLYITTGGGNMYSGVKQWQLLGNSSSIGFFTRDAAGNVYDLSGIPDQTGQYGMYLTTDGTKTFWSNTPTGLPSLAGNTGLYLTNDGNSIFWSNTPVYFNNPMTTLGDMIVGIVSGGGSRLPIGSTGQVLTVVGGTASWAAPASQFPNQTSQSGKFLTTNGSAVSWSAIIQLPTPVGHSGKYLGSDGSNASWSTIPGVLPAISGGVNGWFLTNNGTDPVWTAYADSVAAQGGNGGKFLTTNGSTTSWLSLSASLLPSYSTANNGQVLGIAAGVPVWEAPPIPSQTGNNGYFLTTNGTITSWASPFPPQGTSAGLYLTTNGATVSWAAIPSGFANPMTAPWDMIIGATGGTATRFPVGSLGQVLTVVVGGGVAWAAPAMINPLTTNGDLIYGLATGSPARLGIGGTNQVLMVSGGLPVWSDLTGLPSQTGASGKFLTSNGTSASWASPLPLQTGNSGLFLTTNGTVASWGSTPAGFANPMTALGDLITGGASGAAGRLAIGTTGYMLTVVGGVPAWAASPVPAVNVGVTGYYLTNNGVVSTWAAWPIPAQTGNSGKYLSTDGTNLNWTAPVPPVVGQSGKILTNNGSIVLWAPASTTALPSMTGQNGKYLLTDGTNASWSDVTGALPASNLTNNGQVLEVVGGAPVWTTPTWMISPMTTPGDVIYGGTAGAPTRLALGDPGQALVVGTSGPEWVTLSSMSNPLTTLGDILVGIASGVPSRLGVGSATQVLTVVSGAPAWAAAPLGLPAYSAGNNTQVLEVVAGVPAWTVINQVPAFSVGNNGQILEVVAGVPAWTAPPLGIPSYSTFNNGQVLEIVAGVPVWTALPSGFANPMTTTGDLITSTSGGAATRLGIGSTNQVLTVISGAPAWVTPTASFANPMTAAGDLIVATSGGTAARLAAGGNTQVLTIVAGNPTWAAPASQIPAMSAPTSGQYLTNNGSVASWGTLIVNQVPAPTSGTNGWFLTNNGTTYSWAAIPNSLPSQTGNNGLFLTTNGTVASWTAILVLPAVSGGTAGKVLANDGSTVFWQATASSTTLGAVPLNTTSSVLSVGAGEIKTINTTCYTFQLQTIAATSPCRIRFYPTNALAVADNARPSTQDPTGNVGLLAEFVFTSTALSWIVTPTIICYNLDSTPATNIYMAIQNTGASPIAVTVTGTLIKMQ